MIFFRGKYFWLGKNFQNYCKFVAKFVRYKENGVENPRLSSVSPFPRFLNKKKKFHARFKKNFLANTLKLDLDVFHSHLSSTWNIIDSYFIDPSWHSKSKNVIFVLFLLVWGFSKILWTL